MWWKDQHFWTPNFLISTRGLDYSGDEVRLARKISWKSIEPSLPPEVGMLDIRDFCSHGVLHFITHIDDTMLAMEEQTIGKTPSVMVEEGGWEELASNLIARGLCRAVPESALHHVGSLPLLNGLFAVDKDEVKDGITVGRSIMNLKPWNSNSRPLLGDVGTLPKITGMGALHIHDDECLVTFSEDLRCFFCLFKVPPAWEKYMGFGRLPKSLIPTNAAEDRWYLAGQVLPMGY